MTEPPGLYSTMIQKINIPSGMLLEPLGKIGPYYKYAQFPIPSGEINELTHKIDVTRYTNYPVQIDFELFDYQTKLFEEVRKLCQQDEVIVKYDTKNSNH